MRLLIVHAYDREGRAALERAAATQPDRLYRRQLESLMPGVACDVVHPADADDQLPSGASLSDYDGIIWTGSSLTIHADADPRVRRQVEFARSAYVAGVPSFGSCWAAQVAVVAAGGRCAPSPRGREFGVTAPIRLLGAGTSHPLFQGKPGPFVALASHADEIIELPSGATVLAANDHSAVQAVAVGHGRGTFWAVQYHPEYDLHEIARLSVVRRDELVRQGTFADTDAAAAYVDALEMVHADPTLHELARAFGVDAPELGAEQRSIELRNWLTAQVLPRRVRFGT